MATTKAGPIQADRLKSFIERIEKLEEERKAIDGDIKDVYSEAKGVGYDVGTMRKVVRLRAMDPADRAEQETLLDTYWLALQTVDRIDARLAAGESQREVAAAEGVSKSTVQRRGPKVESASASSKMDRHDANGVITETGEGDATDGLSAPAEGGSRDRGDAREPAEAEQGILSGRPAGPYEGGEGRDGWASGSCSDREDEAPATPSVGAVAAEPRVAISVLTPHVTTDDDLTIPAYLRGPSPANRRAA